MLGHVERDGAGDEADDIAETDAGLVLDGDLGCLRNASGPDSPVTLGRAEG